MSKIEDGGPVHPVHGYQMDASGAYCGQWVANNGMSLRDYFAAQALIALFAASAHPEHIGIAATYYPDTGIECYKIADAMLAARNKRSE